MKITNQSSGEIRISQGESIINYGSAMITTYNLVNCIAIGGRFREPGKTTLSGIFLTHESPTDKITLQNKLSEIKYKLNNCSFDSILIFRIDESQAAKNIYANGKTTEEIIQEMISFTRSTFGLEPDLITYMCDIKTFQCGKASITPTNIISSMETISSESPSTTSRQPLFMVASMAPRSNTMTYMSNVSKLNTNSLKEKFEPIWLKNQYNDWIVKCPICNSISGTYINKLTHGFDCPNKNKLPSIINKPSSGGRKKKNRKTKKRHTRRKFN